MIPILLKNTGRIHRFFGDGCEQDGTPNGYVGIFCTRLPFPKEMYEKLPAVESLAVFGDKACKRCLAREKPVWLKLPKAD